MFIQPVSVFVIYAYFLGLNMVALRVVVERKIPMVFRSKKKVESFAFLLQGSF